MKTKLIALFALATIGVSSAAILFFDSEPVAFESLESKTPTGGAIFNRISYLSAKNRDVWVMQQSHKGYYKDFQKWDRLAIIVDKTTAPKTVQYFQLEPGESEFDPSKKISLKVSCYICHANGPRAVRADFSGIKISVKDQIKLSLWNLRIKTYGKIVADDSVNSDSTIPLKLSKAFDNETLKVKTCVKCHSNQAFSLRSALKRQHFMSIKFLVEKGMMPPPGFSLPRDEYEQVLAFAQGL